PDPRQSRGDRGDPARVPCASAGRAGSPAPTMTYRARAFGLLLGFGIGLTMVGAKAEVPEPDGYRQDKYRGETPATLKGATVVQADELRRMMRQEPVVVID